MKCLVRLTSDSNLREYHIVGAQICEVPYAEFVRPTWGMEEHFSALGTVGEKIAETLMNPDQGDAIERIAFRPNSIRIRKTPTTSWGNIEPTVIKSALEDALDTQLKFKQFTSMPLRELAFA